MAVVTESQLNASQLDAVKKARIAQQRNNDDYSITLLTQVLREVPGFLDGRRLLREISIKKNAGGNKMFRSLSTVTLAPKLLKLQGEIKKNPGLVLASVEEVLASEPLNEQANQILAEAALALGLWETAALAYETLQRANPKDTRILHSLAQLYLQNKDPRARKVYEDIVNLTPTDGAALTGLKNAEALGSLRSGWENAESYRDIIKDKGQAELLEQASKVTKSDDAIDSLIAEMYQKYEAEPQNVLHVRRIADLYKQKGDLASALSYYEYGYELTGRSDPGIEKTIYDLKVKQLDESIQQWRDFVAAAGADPEIESHKATLAGLEKQRMEMSLHEARSRVVKYPNDLQFRFELGEALYKTGDITGAIPELQQALRQPNIRLKAMLTLALCFKAKGQLDIAAKRIEEACSEITIMDETKKDLLYNLGLLRGEMGQIEQSMIAFKEIYEVDYGYRDVASRVEGAGG